jgi:hypothetical protein
MNVQERIFVEKKSWEKVGNFPLENGFLIKKRTLWVFIMKVFAQSCHAPPSKNSSQIPPVDDVSTTEDIPSFDSWVLRENPHLSGLVACVVLENCRSGVIGRDFSFGRGEVLDKV